MARLKEVYKNEIVPALTKQFGDVYADYRKSVPRWLPRRPKLR